MWFDMRRGRSSKVETETFFPVDAVVLWVDGNDAAWRESRAAYLPELKTTGTEEYRFRDWDLMRYWFRGIEAFAPWFNKIYLITCGQRPKWLQKDHPNLVEINHADFIPPEYLPTFNSNVIEIFLNQIEGLSERFVLFNDDTFVVSPTERSDFFSDNGLPRDAAVLGTIASPLTYSVFPFAQLNNSSIINTHFSLPEVLKRERRKFYSLRYGKDVLNNMVLGRGRCISKFHTYHMPQAFLKTTFDEVWKAEPEMLEACARQRFRSKDDVSWYLMQMWQCCSGKFEPRNPHIGRSFVIGRDEGLCEALVSGKYKVVCANDDLDSIDFESEKHKLVAAFESILPVKSSFEA